MLFLDDVRQPENCKSYMHQRIGPLNLLYLEDWVVVRNFDEFIKALITHSKEITHVSFDHDLADAHYHESMYKGGVVYMKYLETVSEKTGLDCAKWMKQYYEDNKLLLPQMFVHSMNPVGTQNIINLFNDKRTSQEGTPEPSK